VGRFRYGMARPQVADGGSGLQIWKVATNILNEQSWTASFVQSEDSLLCSEAPAIGQYP